MITARIKNWLGRFLGPRGKVDEATLRGVRNGIMIATLELKANSMRRVPVDTGNLRASATERFHQDKNNFHGEVSFGNSPEHKIECNYAIYVHEDPDAYHDDGEYKYLYNALQELKPEVSKIICDEINRARRRPL